MKNQNVKFEGILRAEANKYYEKYQNSPGWIEYCLNYIGNCWNIQSVIAETISKLPREVMEFACKQCQFISITEGVCFHLLNTKCEWIIILSETLGKKDIFKTITINIARAWLQHKSLLEAPFGKSKDSEDQALALVANWGLSEYITDGNNQIS
jgi:hypothetical protein